MNIKKFKIEREASELIAKELLKSPNFRFENVCFGGRNGDVLGSICLKRPFEEHYIQMILVRDGDYHSDKYNLVKHFEGKYYKTEKREFSEYEKDEIIKTYYKIDSEIFSDNQEDAKKARQVRRDRYNNTTTNYYGHRHIERVLKPNTKLYDKLFTVCAKEKNIKYGTELTYSINYRDDYAWTGYGAECKKTGITKVNSSISFVYRNKLNSIGRCHFSYDNPKAEFYK